MITKSISELKPNDVINVLNGWYRVRKLRYSNNGTTIDLQREDDQLSPFCDMTCAHVSINKDLDIKFEVKE
ncbi:hypothetical protein [Xenorhabdus bovienii]|uniref:Uncharacterized protein n=1 Tax=Xenorhabdus bovienii str. Intermedium TaxID=1379677 RepID=A0A077QLP1_XENBV|nr:hypothetical protein [Xenorhabdus bovienii]MDE9528340.1 hypothetical protein [Xenorhabdus bovienii]MDE9548894.1 hypothetical protein [Xenorhabdus bovienii]MDE9571490.1 hypothetical protein [Xenorhabdus bovienii]CDH33256.1 conserved hypothetical protein [Xenorhabdus bovienii str. Intermedium]